jgi:hypothetical protein
LKTLHGSEPRRSYHSGRHAVTRACATRNDRLLDFVRPQGRAAAFRPLRSHRALLVGLCAPKAVWFLIPPRRRPPQLAASFMSHVGTNRTNQAGLTMSVDWGGPEVAGLRQTDANDPSETLVVRRNDLYPRSIPVPFQSARFCHYHAMPSPEPGVGHEATRISRCARRCGGVAARGAGADQRKNPANWSFVARSQHRGSGHLPRR